MCLSQVVISVIATAVDAHANYRSGFLLAAFLRATCSPGIFGTSLLLLKRLATINHVCLLLDNSKMIAVTRVLTVIVSKQLQQNVVTRVASEIFYTVSVLVQRFDEFEKCHIRKVSFSLCYK